MPSDTNFYPSDDMFDEFQKRRERGAGRQAQRHGPTLCVILRTHDAAKLSEEEDEK